MFIVECALPTYLYKGRCYDKCPVHTYTIVRQAIEDTATEDGDIPEEATLATTPASSNHNTTTLSCARCDKSCFECFGPLSTECSACYPGSQLRIVPGHNLNNESFCYAFAERSSGNSNTPALVGNSSTTTGHHYLWSLLNLKVSAARTRTTLMIILLLLLVVCVFTYSIHLFWLKKNRDSTGAPPTMTVGKRDSSSFRMSYAYDRVQLMPSDECDEVMIEEEESERNDDDAGEVEEAEEARPDEEEQ